MKYHKRRFKAFSLVEIMLALLISIVLLMAALPLIQLKQKIKNHDADSIACIKAELASNTTSTACSNSITRCKYNQNRACESLIYLADHGQTSPDEQTAARKILGEICDQGGEEACKYLIERCKKDSTVCNIASDDDFYKYLALLPSDTNDGIPSIEEIGKKFYNLGYSNIVSIVDSTCCPDLNVACMIKGSTSCPWQKRLNSSNNNNDKGAGIALDSGGNVYVSGDSNNDIAVLKLDNNGNIIWQKRLNSSNNSGDTGYAIALDSGGNLYVTGDSWNGSNYDLAVLKLDNNGNIIWQKRLNSSNNDRDRVHATTLDSGGNVYITGHSNNGSYDDIPVLKLDNNGNIIWQKRFDSSNNNIDSARAISVDSGGNVYVSGFSYNGSKSNIFALKLDNNGNIIWQKRFNSSTSTGSCYSGEILSDSGGNLYISGSIYSSGSNNDIAVLKLDNNGNIIWQKRFNSSNNADDYLNGIVLDSGGNVYVAGNSSNGSNYDLAVLKLDNNGNIIWDKRRNSSNNADDYLNEIVLDSGGNLYITGYSNNGSNEDIIVLRLSNNQQSDNVFTELSPGFTASSPGFTINSPGFTVSSPFTAGSPGFTINSPGFTGIK